MAGHSKWANIKHRKGNQDAIRSRVFQKLSKEISVAAWKGGSNPDSNPHLRLAIARARSKSMPKSNIEKAISSGTNDKDVSNFKELLYSGNGFNGVSFLVLGLTNNPNRFTANIQMLFRKNNVSIGKQGHIPFVFSRRGILTFNGENLSKEEVLETILDEEIIDLEEKDGSFTVFVDPSSFLSAREKLEKELKIDDFKKIEIAFIPDQLIKIENEEKKKRFVNFLNLLEEDNDIQEVFHNADF